MIKPVEVGQQRVAIEPGLAEQGAHLGPLERDGRTVGIVLVVGVGVLVGLDDVVESACEPGDLGLGSGKLVVDRRAQRSAGPRGERREGRSHLGEGTGETDTVDEVTDALHLTATLEPRGPAGAFLLTDEQVAAIGGGKKAFPVTVSIDGRTLALRLARMGGENMIGLSQAARAEARVEIGSTYDVEISADAGERTVEVPDDLAAALAAEPALEASFTRMAYSHRKEYVRWITEAKKAETRATRVAKAVEMISAGETR